MCVTVNKNKHGFTIKRKTKNTTVRTFLKSNRQYNKEAQSMPVTHVYDTLFSWLGTGTSIKKWRV